MTIRQTLQALVDSLPPQEARELEALIQAWPNNDDEIQTLIEANLGEILALFRPTAHSSKLSSKLSPKPSPQKEVSLPFADVYGSDVYGSDIYGSDTSNNAGNQPVRVIDFSPLSSMANLN